MEFHKPHAAKTWGEFFIEIGTIVTGILIALALEQGLQALHDHKVEDEARAALRDEAAQNLYWVGVRERGEPCVRQELVEVADLLDLADRQAPFAVAQDVSLPVHVKITTQVWDANAQAGRTSLFSTDEQRNLGNFYFTTGELKSFQAKEEEAWAKLGALEGRTKLSQASTDAFRVNLAEARYYNRRVLLSVRRAHQWADILRLKPGAAAGLPGSITTSTVFRCTRITGQAR